MVKIFVTGVAASGKTHFATRHAAERGIDYVAFDLAHDYRQGSEQSRAILDSLPESFVIDAIPFDVDGSTSRFFEYEEQHDDVEVIWVYCPRPEWLRRVEKKATFGGRQRGLLAMVVAARPKRPYDYPRYILNLARRATGKVRAWINARSLRKVRDDLASKRKSLRAAQAEALLVRYRSFFDRWLGVDIRKLSYFDSSADEYTTREEMLRRIRYETFELEDYLQGLDANIDKLYQDIEVLELVGYSESFRTWERVVGLADWKGQRVVDIGCHHGYFSFKAADAGATVVGLDRSIPALNVARRIDALRGGTTRFLEWSDDEELPEGDIVLLLNVLHHLGDADHVLSQLRGSDVILEINASDKPLVERYLVVEREVRSHRDNRLILKTRPSQAGSPTSGG